MRKIRLSKSHQLRFVLLLALSLGTGASVLPFTTSQARQADDSGCTTETIGGDYVFRATGVDDFAAVGRYVRDGQGNIVSVTITGNTKGSVAQSHATGTYTVNSDCTGSQTLTFDNGAVTQGFFVVAEQGRIVEFVISSGPGVHSGTQTKV